MGADVAWDCERAKTPEGYYQIRGGIPYAIAKSLAAAPFADILWMETKTADLADAKQFADAIHAEFPDQMMAYNLSPSFNWDTTGMTDDEMRAFPEELGKMGFVFNFITYGGHQVDGVACEEFANVAAAGGHARAGPPATQDATRRISLPHTANPGRRTAQRCRARPPRRAARRPPRRWARAPRSISTWCRPRCRRSSWRNGWRCGATTISSARSCGCSCGRGAPGPTCWTSGSTATARNRWPTSSSIRSRTGTAAAFSRCATRTRSPRRCARSA